MNTASHSPVRSITLRILTLLAAGSVIAGIILLLFPSALTLLHKHDQTDDLSTYEKAVSQMDDLTVQAAYDKARSYNANLPGNTALFALTGEDEAVYQKTLDPAGTGVMGSVRIPALGLTLPIYHGTSSAQMLKGTCHVEGTALPIGEPSTHAALTAHRGEPGASYFKDLDRLAEGDTFDVTVLDKTSTYQVDRIVVVEPDDLGALERVEGQAYCTLITCTPYGVNTHRLLVRGRCLETRSAG